MKSTKQALTQTLGKRAGPDGAEEYAAQAARGKNMRTSMLFMELQESVSEALRWRHARDVKARKISAEIAARCPLTFPGEAAPAVQRNAQSSVDSAATVERVKPYAPVVSFEEKMKAEANEGEIPVHTTIAGAIDSSGARRGVHGAYQGCGAVS